MADLAGWPYWKVIAITGQAGSGTDFQVKLVIGDSAGGDFHLEGHCTNFPQDIRVTDDDGTTLLDHFIEDLTADPIVIHVKVDDDLGSNQSVRIYYSNVGETTNSDINATFLLGDDFTAGSLDTAKWNALTQGTATVTQSGDGTVKLSLPTTLNNYAVLQSKYTFGIGHRLKAKFKARRGIYRMYSSLGFNCYLNPRTPTDFVGETDTTGVATNKYIYGSAVDAGNQDFGATGTYNPDDNIYYPFEILRYIGGSKIYWNDVLIHTPITQVPADSMPVEIGVGTYVSGAAASATDSYIDFVFVAKYNDPEPAFASAGAEQTPVTGHPTMRRLGGIPFMPHGTGRRSW